MIGRSHYTSDHNEIRQWVEERGGKPASVEGTERDSGAGVLRIDFPGYGEDEKLEHISWDEWFRKFDENDLVMVMQEETSGGKTSRFNKIVSRDSVEEREGQGNGQPSSGRGRSESSRRR